MVTGAEELPSWGVRGPFWDFLAIPEHGAGKVSWAAPDTSLLEMLAIDLKFVWPVKERMLHHEFLKMGEAHMARPKMQWEEVLLGCGNVSVGFIKNGQGDNPMMSTAGAGGRKQQIMIGSALGVKTPPPPLIAWCFCGGNGMVGTRIDWTLKLSGSMVGVHPKIVGITAKWILRSVKAVKMAKS